MERATIDRPGRIIFLSGLVCVVASTFLGFYLIRRSPDHIEPPDWHTPTYDSERAEIGRIHAFLVEVDVLMWLTFILGTILTLVGLRMLTRPRLENHPVPPLGSIRDVYEIPK